MEKHYSVKETAELFHCSSAAVRKWLCTGRMPFYKIGGLTRIRATDLQSFVKVGSASTKAERAA
jgi:excisionase family DNA binding protein